MARTAAPRDTRKRLKARPMPPVPPTIATLIPLRSRLRASTRRQTKFLSRLAITVLLSLVLLQAITHIDPLARYPPILAGDKHRDHGSECLPRIAAGTGEEPSSRPIRWKQRETNRLASALFRSLVAAVLVQISCGKPRIGRVHFDSRIAQLESQLYREHVESCL